MNNLCCTTLGQFAPPPTIAPRPSLAHRLLAKTEGAIVMALLAFFIASFANGAWARADGYGAGTNTNSKPDAGARVLQLADEYFEHRLRLFPLSATEDVADVRFEGELQIEIAPAHRAEQAAVFGKILAALNAIDRRQLSKDDALTYDVLKYDIGNRIDALKFPNHLLPIHHMESVPVKLAGWGSGNSVQPFKTVANYENYLQRIEKLPVWVEQAMANLREGMRIGVTQNREITVRALPQFEALTEIHLERNPFFSPIGKMPVTFSEQDKARISSAYRKVISEKIIPAQTRLYAFIKNEYLPKTRASAGLSALPGGTEWYRFMVKDSTTTTMTAEAIHAVGLKEVARIHAEMEKVKTQVAFKGSLIDFLKGLEKRPELAPFKTEEEVMAKFAAMNANVKPQLALLFGRAPKAPLEIRPVDKLIRETASSHYILPAADGSRPGVFYAVVHDPLKYTTPSMAALFLHEGQPGHHFQMAIQQELTLPRFRRYLWYDAYGEGWALYAESLGRELGVYDDPYAYLGRLQSELHRAIRLVVDTGLHAKGWSREQTIKYMMESEGSLEPSARRATERYMVWAGQALSYKIGELKILELRARAQKTLGNKFDVRAFHDEVLGSGALPLSMLESRVDAWVWGIAHSK
jgi:uncharacterized protein (DUF885 family)